MKTPLKLYDPNLLQREYWNGHIDKKSGIPKDNPFTVIAIRNDFVNVNSKKVPLNLYCAGAGKVLGPKEIRIRSGTFAYFHHGYYTFSIEGASKGEEFDMVTNMERMIGIGNKIPSNGFGLNKEQED